MAYRDLLQGRDVFEVQGLVRKNGSQYISRSQIGDDDETGHVYSVLVILEPAIANPPQYMELKFFLAVANPKTGHIDELSDGRQTKQFLNSPDLRLSVLQLICSVSCDLLKVAKPQRVHYVSADVNLPSKALTKYTFLCKALKSVGYEGREVDKYLGNHMWLLERVDA